MGKINNILANLKVIKSGDDNSKLINLTKIPPKEKSQPTTHSGKKDASHQADLLYLPDDNGYLYLLVVVDIATRLIDVEPLKKRDSKTVMNALKTIYKRKILNSPKYLEVDDGSEFKADFQKYFEKILKIVRKLPYRSRSQAVVESKNAVIGTVLNKAMLSSEINNDAVSTKWVYLVKDLVKYINKEYSITPTITKPEEKVIVNDFTADLIPEGTRVRYKLDKPSDYVSGKRLHGRFRSGDIRWSKTIHKVEQISLRPAQVPLYLLDNMPVKVGFSKEQLSVVKDDEKMPEIHDGQEQYAQEITGKRKVKGLVEYEVLWENKQTSWEELKNIKADLKEMIKDYETMNKAKK